MDSIARCADFDAQRCKHLATELEALSRAAPTSIDDVTRKHLLDAATSVIPLLETKADVVQRVLNTPLEAMAVRIGHQMGLFANLSQAGGCMTTMEIAESLNGNVSIVERLIKFIASLNMVSEVDVNVWKASNLTHILADHGVQGGAFINSVSLGTTWQLYPEWLHDNQYQRCTDINDTAFSRGHGCRINPFKFYTEYPGHFAHFNQFMTVQRYGHQMWLDSFPFEEIVVDQANADAALFVDVGGGIGHQCEALVSKFPSISGRIVLQDQAEPIEAALALPGVEKTVIDFFEHQPVRGARAYYLRNILHGESQMTDV